MGKPHRDKEKRYARLLARLLRQRSYQGWLPLLGDLPLRLHREFRSYDVQVEIEILHEMDNCLHMCVSVDFGTVLNGDGDRDTPFGVWPLPLSDYEVSSHDFYIVNLEYLSRERWIDLLGTRSIS